jgi:hypothetical protein
MKTREPDVSRKHKRVPLEDVDDDFDQRAEARKSGKSKVECICPGCGKIHIMKILWTGRGMCRKFCESCRDRQTPIDVEDVP